MTSDTKALMADTSTGMRSGASAEKPEPIDAQISIVESDAGASGSEQLIDGTKFLVNLVTAGQHLFVGEGDFYFCTD